MKTAKQIVRNVLVSNVNGITRAKLAKKAGISEVTVQTYIADFKNPAYAGSEGPLKIVHLTDGRYILAKFAKAAIAASK